MPSFLPLYNLCYAVSKVGYSLDGNAVEALKIVQLPVDAIEVTRFRYMQDERGDRSLQQNSIEQRRNCGKLEQDIFFVTFHFIRLRMCSLQ